MSQAEIQGYNSSYLDDKYHIYSKYLVIETLLNLS